MSIRWITRVASLALVIGFAPSVAHAALFDFTYDFGPNTLTGEVEGELQPDGDTIVVSSVISFDVNGMGEISLPLVSSLQFFFDSGSLGGDPVVSLSGAVMDILACDTLPPGCEDGYAFLSGPAGEFTGFGFGALDGVEDRFDRSQWSLTRVFEPSTLVLVGAGGLVLVRRRDAAS